MDDLTVDEKMNFGARRGREKEAEEHFFDIAQPFYPLGFSVIYRNPGHWDIIARECPGRASAWRAAHTDGYTSAQDGQRVRAFRIRGKPDEVLIMDERWNPRQPHPRESLKFRSIQSAMLWIIEELMQEPPAAPVP